VKLLYASELLVPVFRQTRWLSALLGILQVGLTGLAFERARRGASRASDS
jgi:hypothetical protein